MAKKRESSENVTRIKASDANTKAPKSSSKKAKPAKATVVSAPKTKRTLPKPIAGIVGYFKGAWYELRQVHWPTRRATWGLTAAVLGFSAFFVAFILAFDALFKYLFEIILK